ncbi:MAG: DUF1902 domain-containing protein [Burkholderiales bacterium]|nr:DUF1902 domain-containing protein [Burkholderiales bacterium]
MSLHYRYSWPFGQLLARIGVPTKIRVDVIRDQEAGVFVGTSEDVRGLVVEAETLDALVSEAMELIPELMHESAANERDIVDVRLRSRAGVCHA